MNDEQDRLDLPRSPRSGTTWEVDIEDLATDGRGVGRLRALVGPQDEPKEFEFHVRKAVPGDRVEALVERRRGETIDARIAGFLARSEERTEPRCPHFGRREIEGEGCGGCTMQGFAYDRQLEAKQRIVERFFRSHGLDTEIVAEIEGQEDPWYYRNNMEFSFGDTADREFALGLHPTGYRHEIVNLETCYLQSPFTAEFVPRVRSWATEHGLEPYINSENSGFLRTLTIREGERTGERLIDLMTTHDPEAAWEGEKVEARRVAEAFAAFAQETADELDAAATSIYWTQKRAIQGQPTEWIEHCIAGRDVLEEQLHLPGGEVLDFEISPRAFFQTNTEQAERLYAEVLRQSGLRDRNDPASCVFDLYCGTGTIALAMSPYADRVAGVEMQADAVENARENAALNGIDHAEFRVGDVGEVLESVDFRASVGDPDVAVVDPPRAGLQPDARRQVGELGADRLVYVSCHPEHLARDVAELADWGYELREAQPIDMFPHTYHIECVARLERSFGEERGGAGEP